MNKLRVFPLLGEAVAMVARTECSSRMAAAGLALTSSTASGKPEAGRP